MTKYCRSYDKKILVCFLCLTVYLSELLRRAEASTSTLFASKYHLVNYYLVVFTAKGAKMLIVLLATTDQLFDSCVACS